MEASSSCFHIAAFVKKLFQLRKVFASYCPLIGNEIMKKRESLLDTEVKSRVGMFAFAKVVASNHVCGVSS